MSLSIPVFTTVGDIARKFRAEVESAGYRSEDVVAVQVWDTPRFDRVAIEFTMGGRTGRAQLLRRMGMGL